MSDRTLHLTPEIYKYLLDHSLREPEVLKELRQQTDKMSMSQMQISPEQGQFMGLLVKLMNAKKALDIGTFTGYSALSIALAMPADGKVIACDKNKEWTKIALKYWEKAGVAHQITLKVAPALDTLMSLIERGESGTFDFAFIDADKANYLAYYQLVLKLLRPGGLVAVDNVLWSGKVADPSIQDRGTQAIRELNNYLFQDETVLISLLPIGDGLTLALKK